ncbi:hypothetical protein PAT3040_00976 [Paenibacillus agaridevorans]|uniref:Pectate lyase superfamily protein domain-containing protein n=1 Tax=Paenibacillus agaridevorans TaxID=171404 RepID=A0A2R5ELD3_9BACL|nr:right-handed parallel beta-helix repeat-containing protein [Paenibacillus agaridevorans]GBG06449.1 hypothetical protein PAT3040_00976 [Paenibacillus agaridevorans]
MKLGEEKLGSEENKVKESLISRRKLLASMGIAGVGLASSNLLGGAGQAYAAESEVQRNRVQDLLALNLMVPVTIAQLRAEESPGLGALYYVQDRGMEGMFRYDPSDQVSADDTGGVLVSTAGKRFKRIVEDDVSAKWFGAKGDGETDDSFAIVQANAYAAAGGRAVYFPGGTYRAHGLLPTVSWYSRERAVIKSNFNPGMSEFDRDFVKVINQTGLTFEGLVFDGNVSADPDAWNSSNYNAFAGSIAFDIWGSQHIVLRNCVFRNSFFSTVRIESESSHITLENCRLMHARGNFGDCFYSQKSHDLTLINCIAEDYTRIGFVNDLVVYNVDYSLCFATNGHNSSVLYGGAEYNAGFWAEQTVSVTYSQCVAENNSDRGFVAIAGGPLPTRTESASFIFQSCIAYNNKGYGFIVGTYEEHHNVTASMNGCASYKCLNGITIVARNTADSYRLTDCHVELSSEGDHEYIGYLILGAPGISPRIKLNNCVTNCNNRADNKFLSPDHMTADIMLYESGKPIIELNGVSNNGLYNGDAAPVFIKTNNSVPELYVTGSNIALPYIQDFTKLSFVRCRFISSSQFIGNPAATGEISLQDCEIIAPTTIMTNGRVQLRSVTMKLSSHQQLKVSRSASTRASATEFVQCRIIKNITDSAVEAIKLEDTGGAGSNVWFQHCIFQNEGGAPTSAKAFIESTNSDTKAWFDASYSDQSVTSAMKTGGTLSTPVGLSLIALQ